MRKTITMLAVISLALAGCGDSEEGATTSSTTAAPETTTTAADQAADQARLEALILTSADVPEGWTEVPTPDTAPERGSESTLETCLGLPEGTLDYAVEASTTFTRVTNSIVSGATADDSVEEADAARQALASPTGPDCMASEINSAIVEQFEAFGATVEPVSTTEPIPGITLREGEFGIRVNTSFEANGQPFTTVADFVNVPDGRFDSSLTVIRLDSAPQPELTNSLVEAIRTRIAA